ncbi:histidine kinase [Pseudoxanthomonas broegbernensis]|uniref:histidine kinase n=1 Tax=Pseudoxanthomonas broegbernensis TaxID=83619 RepID=A0A7V8GKT4_9GAMM|nr:sensor histidine kinase [Pseudoxanthomonas broegbernensis]KAF1685364.1 histidine kinase [Pseudoxanthomonas broegbernensis]MBB6066428.1 two-component system sensor histidine kinase TctE [Pseudoxanthomonas broegbernensis]
MRERVLSLKARLVGTMALLFLAGTVAMYLAARAYGLRAADLSYDRLLAGSALSIAETLSVDGAQVRVDIPYAALDMLSAAPEDKVFYRVFGPGAQTVTGYADLPQIPASRFRRDEPSELPAPRFFDATFRGEVVRFVLLGRQLAQPGLHGWVWVQVGQTRQAREELAGELVLGALLPIALLTSLALALAWFGVGRALRPLESLSADLAGREPSDLHALGVPVPAEVQPMVNAMNGFMRRLEGNMAGLRSFIGDAAHQIRTPLAGLRAQAQLALEEDDPREMRRGLANVERNAQRLTRLVNQLLSDAMVMHRADLRSFESFDLVDVIKRAMRDAVPMSGDVQVGFISSMARARMRGDAVLLGEAIKNLIDNAIRHGTPDAFGPDAEVEIALRQEGDTYALTVSDRGQGIAEADRARIFERFERAGTRSSGAGLGMAIVSRVVNSHGGTIELIDREGGGLTVRLSLRGMR